MSPRGALMRRAQREMPEAGWRRLRSLSGAATRRAGSQGDRLAADDLLGEAFGVVALQGMHGAEQEGAVRRAEERGELGALCGRVEREMYGLEQRVASELEAMFRPLSTGAYYRSTMSTPPAVYFTA